MKNKKIKVVLIEDDPFLSNMYVTKLQASDFEIIAEEDGQKGLQTVAKEQPDLILLDILLPGIDGFEILKKLKSDAKMKEIPVIMLTNLGQKNDVEKGLDLGANDYLIKAHFTPTEVITKITKTIENNKK